MTSLNSPREENSVRGQWRKHVQDAYTGSPSELLKIQQKNVEANLALLQRNESFRSVMKNFLAAKGVWYIGRASCGLPLGKNDRYELVVMVEEELSPFAARLVREKVQEMTGKRFTLLFVPCDFEVGADYLEVDFLSTPSS